jgi:hypothetical protein
VIDLLTLDQIILIYIHIVKVKHDRFHKS